MENFGTVRNNLNFARNLFPLFCFSARHPTHITFSLKALTTYSFELNHVWQLFLTNESKWISSILRSTYDRITLTCTYLSYDERLFPSKVFPNLAKFLRNLKFAMLKSFSWSTECTLTNYHYRITTSKSRWIEWYIASKWFFIFTNFRFEKPNSVIERVESYRPERYVCGYIHKFLPSALYLK